MVNLKRAAALGEVAHHVHGAAQVYEHAIETVGVKIQAILVRAWTAGALRSNSFAGSATKDQQVRGIVITKSSAVGAAGINVHSVGKLRAARRPHHKAIDRSTGGGRCRGVVAPGEASVLVGARVLPGGKGSLAGSPRRGGVAGGVVLPCGDEGVVTAGVIESPSGHGGTGAAGGVLAASTYGCIVAAGGVAKAATHGGKVAAGGVERAAAHAAEITADLVSVGATTTGDGGADRSVGYCVKTGASNHIGCGAKRNEVVSLRLNAEGAAAVNPQLEGLIVIGSQPVGSRRSAGIPAQAPEILCAVARALLRGKGYHSSASVDGQAADDQVAAVIEQEPGIHQGVRGADFGNGADVGARAEEDLVEHGPIRFFRAGRSALPDQRTPRLQAGHLQWLLRVDINDRG